MTLPTVHINLLQFGIALMAVVSLNPYFMWGEQKAWYGAAAIIVVASGLAGLRELLFTRERILFSVAFSLFLAYLSVLPKVHGGTTRWFFLIPFTVVLLHLRPEHLRGAFDKFLWLFAISVVPGMVLWIWSTAGLPVVGRFMTPPSDIVQRGVTEYLELPGAVFLLANALILPHGGTLFRLCGVYDEPGTVGTIAALSLAATRFQLTNVRGAVLFVAGLMSLSIAFAVLTTIGSVAVALFCKRPWLLPAALFSLVACLIPLSGLKSAQQVSNVTIIADSAADISFSSTESTAPSATARDGPVRERFVPSPEWGLRNSPQLDNRAEPWMRKLLEEYSNASAKSLLFGIASDASIVHGWGSSVWYRVLTDFGLVGFIWLFALFAFPVALQWRDSRLHVATMIFCTLFLMSFYQRPIIWLPAQLLIYLAGIYASSRKARPVGQPAGAMLR